MWAFERRRLAEVEGVCRVEEAEELNGGGHHARPARLVTRAEAGTVVPVKYS
jgi:hypothetical protein